MNNKLVQIDHVSAGYDKRLVLKDIVLSVEENDFLGIIGPNGGGKTTLLKVMLGLLKPASGSVRFFENNLPVPHLNIGYLPQLNKIDRRFPISVREVVASGLIDHKPLFRSYTKEQQQQIEHVLEQMEIAELADRSIAQLSGGQLQRVLLGRAIVSHPKLLILDEPNSYVDKRFESKFYHLLEEINKEAAVVLVSHDIGTVLSLVKNIACVNETLHYHPGTEVSGQWLEETFGCPFELVGHGSLPHRVLKTHQHD